MKKLLQFVGVSFAVSLAATQANAVTYNLGALISSGDSFTIGDKVFDDFGFASAAFNSNDATVTPSIDGNGVYHLTFQGPWVAAGGQNADIALSYTVATTSGQPLIEAIGQSYVLSAAGQGGFILIGETVRTGGFAGPTTAQSSLSFVTGDPGLTDLEDPVAEPLTGDDLLVNPTEAKLWVTKDIFFGANRGGLIGPTTIRQSFHQISMPEGGTTVAALGFALAGIGLVRRKLTA
jgi:hypothetical protein